MILPIYLYGQPVLRQVAEDITSDYPNLKQLIDNMFETMYDSDGIGLAAPQIGLSIRLFVIDLDALSDDEPKYKGFKKVFINAHIVEESGDVSAMGEGCLSVPGLHEKVPRKGYLKLRYLDEDFKEQEIVFEDFFARVVKHEYDHLDGTLFFDHISPLRKRMNKSKLNNILKGKVRCHYLNKPVHQKR